MPRCPQAPLSGGCACGVGHRSASAPPWLQLGHAKVRRRLLRQTLLHRQDSKAPMSGPAPCGRWTLRYAIGEAQSNRALDSAGLSARSESALTAMSVKRGSTEVLLPPVVSTSAHPDWIVPLPFSQKTLLSIATGPFGQVLSWLTP